MKTKFLLPKLFALVACLMCAMSAVAAEAYAHYSSGTLTFYYDNLRSSRPGTTYDLNVGTNRPGWYTDGSNSSVTRVVFNSSFADARPTSTAYWFTTMSNLQSITGIAYLNTSEVTYMTYMFSGCYGLTSLDVSGFNTAKVVSMNGMFYGCSSLTNLDVSHFNTAKLTDMSSMFQGCFSLKSLDVSGFTTSNVTNMYFMFYQCSSLVSLDLRSFSTQNVTNMRSMFCGCSKLTTIYVGDDWSTAAVTSSSQMFYNCTKLMGGMGTTYDSGHIDVEYAHIDGGLSNPGYFTGNLVRGDVNGDNEVNITDVIQLINYVSNGHW
jgi:surface protein